MLACRCRRQADRGPLRQAPQRQVPSARGRDGLSHLRTALRLLRFTLPRGEYNSATYIVLYYILYCNNTMAAGDGFSPAAHRGD
jgi:hypothetical protein